MKKIFLSLAVVASVFLSCTDDDVNNYSGGPHLVGFNRATEARNFVASGDVEVLNLPVVLLGGQTGLPADSDITVTYTVDPASTAVAGFEYDMVNAGGTAVIPAGLTVGNIPININTGNLEAGPGIVPKQLILNITSVSSEDGAVVATNYSRVVIDIVGACFSNLAGNYTINYTSGPYPVIITEIGVGSYHSTVTPGWAQQYEMFFSEVCGVITVTDWAYSNPISGTGTVAENGNILFTNMTIEGVAGYTNLNWTFVKN